MPTLLTPDEAAKLLRLSKSSLYKYCMERRVPFVKYEGKLLFSAERLEKWIVDRSVEPIRGRGAIAGAR